MKILTTPYCAMNDHIAEFLSKDQFDKIWIYPLSSNVFHHLIYNKQIPTKLIAQEFHGYTISNPIQQYNPVLIGRNLAANPPEVAKIYNIDTYYALSPAVSDKRYHIHTDLVFTTLIHVQFSDNGDHSVITHKTVPSHTSKFYALFYKMQHDILTARLKNKKKYMYHKDIGWQLTEEVNLYLDRTKFAPVNLNNSAHAKQISMDEVLMHVTGHDKRIESKIMLSLNRILDQATFTDERIM